MKQKLQALLLAVGATVTLLSPALVTTNAYAVNCAVLPDAICKKTEADNKNVETSGIMAILKLAIQILTGIIGIVAVGVFVFAGILYASAGDKSDQISRAKNLITQAVIGIVAYAMMFFALQWLVPGGII